MSGFAVLFITLLLLSTIVMKIKGVDSFSPLFIVFATWSFIFSLLFWGDLGLYPLSDRLLSYYLLWFITFFIGTRLAYSIKISRHYQTKSIFIQDRFKFLYKLVLFSIPFLIYKIAVIVMAGGDVFVSLRMANLGTNDDFEGIGVLAYVSPIALVLFLSELYHIKPHDSAKRLYTLLFVNLLFVVASMAKVAIFFLIVPSIVICKIKYNIKISKILLWGACLVLFLSVIQLGRDYEKGDNVYKIVVEMFTAYLFAGVPAMDQVLEEGAYSGLWGESVFNSFYKLLKVLGFDIQFGTGKLFEGSGGYAMVPIPTNVFSCLYDFYIDFGVTGIAIFGCLTGLYSTTLYRLAQRKHIWALILYSHIFASLSLEFFADFIFRMLSSSIQLFFWCYFLYHKSFLKNILNSR